MKVWNGEALEGKWLITYKIDGVKAVVKDGKALSRAGKPLYNLPTLEDGEYEIFRKDWETSVHLVRTKNEDTGITMKDVYRLEPVPDSRLYLRGVWYNPTKETILKIMDQALRFGYEGLVLRQGDTRLKVKPVETYDVAVIGRYSGKGKHLGKIGGLITEKGRVGTGFTDEQRKKFKRLKLGTMIEVQSMGLTKNGKFRHPRFIRVRWDRNEHSA